MGKQYPRFISFEGIDNCGKTTQIQRLLERLKPYNIHPHIVREPGGTPISEAVRAILLNRQYQEMHPHTEILLYSAARSQLVNEQLLPLLEQGQYLIADRFFDSTTAYQGYGRGIDLQVVHMLNQFATGGLTPAKTILIDITPQTASARQQEDRDRLEEGGMAFYQRVREGFLQIARQHHERFVVINGEQSEDQVADAVWAVVQELWELATPSK